MTEIIIPKWKIILGWIAVGLSLAVSCMWSIWGILENFHEGWYSSSIWENILLMLIQYVPFALTFILLPIIAIRWHKIGLGLFLALAVFVPIFFSGASFDVVYLMLTFPLIGLGLLFFFGHPQPARLAIWLLAGIPLAIMIGVSIPNIIRIQGRLNDGDFGPRQVECQGQPLIWAGRGAGFPEQGNSWQEAQSACARLSEDGTQLMDEEQNFWRLPSVEEAVRCQTRNNENAGGVWNEQTHQASYRHTPDKETPLWDSNSPIIYYWTAQAVPNQKDQAYIIDYKGGVFAKNITYSPDYRTYRCVQDAQ
jgi:hypothetical protein